MSTRRTPETVSFVLALFVVAILNIPFWRLFHRVLAPQSAYEWGFMAAVFIALLAAAYLSFLLLAVRPLLRPLAGLLLIMSAAASYFMLEYGAVIDVNMVRNVFETNWAEAGDLMTAKLFAYVALLGLVPAALLWFLPIEWPGMREDFWRKLKSAAIALPVTAVILFPFVPALTSTFRENRVLRLTLTPSNFIDALNKYTRSKYKLARTNVVQPIGTDAVRTPPAGGRPMLFVIAVGETARADHFSLNGYKRATNPELSQVADLINYPSVSSCGTDTAESVPCMFSGLGRENFSNSAAASRQNLLDVLARAGFDVIWRENQAGCKGVCDRVKTEILTGQKDPASYGHTESHDDVLVDGLAEQINGLKKDTVIVMHMMGSHGPAYWKRYPPQFEMFKPVCSESQFSRCTREAIVNAYDNTIVYSDHVLARLIGILQAGAGTADTGMIYMSDHGESLGENNLYLHGMPYAMAPEAQTHVPMVAWLSESLRKRASSDIGCLKHSTERKRSHDNLFHSVLGILDVKTNIYDSSLDLFAPCRNGKVLGGAGAATPVSLH